MNYLYKNIKVYNMTMSNSNDKFTPTIDWLREKYDEMNNTIFEGKLGNCNFEVFTSGKGSQGRTFGHFGFRRKGLKIRRSDRRLIYYIGTEVFTINENNFYEETKPIIGINGNYKRTESAWLNTLVHEMCHYYTYRRGYAPVQAHGTEFRNIAAFVGWKSNGVFDIKRLTSDEEAELDSKISDRNEKREANKKSKLKVILVFKKTGQVQLITTTSEALIDKIVTQNDSRFCDKILKSESPELVEYLWKKGYKNNMKAYRFWSVQNTDVVNEFNKYPHTRLERWGINEVFNLTEADIKLMVEMTINRLMGQQNDEYVDINPNMNLSLETPLEL